MVGYNYSLLISGMKTASINISKPEVVFSYIVPVSCSYF